MAWVYLIALSVGAWCAWALITYMPLSHLSVTTLTRLHFAFAPVIAFVVSAAHKLIAPDFEPVLRAAALTILAAPLDPTIVAPLFDRNYAPFRSSVVNWLPLPAIFLASLAAGVLVPA